MTRRCVSVPGIASRANRQGMFAILDTDHFSAIDRDSAVAQAFHRRRRAYAGELFLSIVTVEEVMRGWLALLASKRKRQDEIAVYERMQRSAEMIAEWQLLPFDREALEHFDRLKSARLKMSTLDLKIASIALAYDATLLSRNLRDFRQVPGLKVENWLDD